MHGRGRHDLPPDLHPAELSPLGAQAGPWGLSPHGSAWPGEQAQVLTRARWRTDVGQPVPSAHVWRTAFHIVDRLIWATGSWQGHLLGVTTPTQRALAPAAACNLTRCDGHLNLPSYPGPPKVTTPMCRLGVSTWRPPPCPDAPAPSDYRVCGPCMGRSEQ